MVWISITITRLLFALAVLLFVGSKGIRINKKKLISGKIPKLKNDQSAVVSLLEDQSSVIFALPEHTKILKNYGNNKNSPDTLENDLEKIAEYRISRDNPSVDKLIRDANEISGSGSGDDDECSLGIHNCHPEALCTDTTSSFNCTCKDGFTGNGTYCERFVGVDVKVILTRNFTDALNQKSSREYIEIKNAIEVELGHSFRHVPKFKEINVVDVSRAGDNKTRVDFVVVYTSSAIERKEIERLAKIFDFPSSNVLIGNISIEGQTLEIKAAPLPPTDISFKNVEDSEIVVTWTNPGFLKNFKNASCHVIYQDLDTSEVGAVQVEPSQSSVLLENLQSDTIYEIFVRCQNKYGQGENSTSIKVKTEDGKWYSTTIIVIIVIVIIGVLVLFALSIFILLKKKKPENRTEPKGEAGVDSTEMQLKKSNLGYDTSLSGSEPKIYVDSENNQLS